jgi:putative membrane protein
MLRQLLVAWFLCACAVAATAWLLPGIDIEGGFGAFLLIALIWGLVNCLLGPIVRLLSLPVTLITLGLFAFVVNGFLFAVTAWIADAMSVDNFLWAIVGAILLSFLNFLFNWFTHRVFARA